MYKNIEKQIKLQLKDQIDYQPGMVTVRMLYMVKKNLKCSLLFRSEHM